MNINLLGIIIVIVLGGWALYQSHKDINNV